MGTKEKSREEKLIDEIDEVMSLMTQGEYAWWQSAPGVDRKEYIDEITRKTAEHPEQNDRVHSVGIMHDGEEITIALTGFGPKSHANARGITLALQSMPWLLHTLRKYHTALDRIASARGSDKEQELSYCIMVATEALKS